MASGQGIKWHMSYVVCQLSPDVTRCHVLRFSPVLVCDSPADQQNGHRLNCPLTFPFGSVCSFECDAGYQLESGAVDKIQCVTKSSGDTPTPEWDYTPSPCKSASQVICLQLYGCLE